MMSLAVSGLMMLNVVAGLGDGGPFEDAQWIRSPRFEGIEVLDLLHKESQPGPELSGPQNVHTLFRKEIQLREAPVQAVAAVTGDDYYVLYVNGNYAVQGPEAGYPSAHPYYLLDITPFLEAGPNTLAAHTYYQGLLNRVWNSADNRSGFMLCLKVRYADGGEETFTTDSSWRCHNLEAFPTGDTVGYKTQFLEHIDMRKMPGAWREQGFDDSAWPSPLTGFQDHYFVQQITPPLQRYRVDAQVAKKIEEGRYFYDFGHEIAGHTRIRIQGPAGHTITVHHGEELLEPDRVRYELRASCVYEEKPVLSGGEDCIEFYDYRAFRYVEILDAPEEPEVWVEVRHHPFDPQAATLTSSKPLLEDIWRICSRGVQMGSQGGFLDCPTREKGAYLGDAVISARSHLWLTADPSLTKKTLWDFMQSRRICPGLMAVAPGSFMQEIAEYSLQYPLLLWEYYRQSGDRAFVLEVADTVLPGLFEYFEGYENGAGLLEGYKDKWVLVDWPKNLRDEFDYDFANAGENTVLNAFYYGALQKAAEIERALGRDGSAYEKKAERIADAFSSRFVDPATGLYLDAPGSGHSSLHANAVPLAFGLTAGANPDRMVALIREKGLCCGVYIASYVIEACFKYGAADLGYALLVSEDEHSWHEMIKNGATTCMEAWGPDQKWNTSWCHPWSSSPIYLIAEYVMGLSPAEPGWSKVRVDPPLIEDLPAIELRLPHRKGAIAARYTPGQGYRYTMPAGVPAETGNREGVSVVIDQENPSAPAVLDTAAQACLEQYRWNEKVGEGLGLWVSVGRQRMYLIQAGRALWEAPCATAALGTGSEADSLRTPLGWHAVAEKIGDGSPWGQVFRSRRATHEVWKRGGNTEEDLVLTRILWLEGREPGKNAGRDAKGRLVDSKERCIYIHGTNGEDRLGVPSSHGCVRLSNDDVIAAYEKIPQGTPVLITEEGSPGLLSQTETPRCAAAAPPQS